jgi:hypothetical protein
MESAKVIRVREILETSVDRNIPPDVGCFIGNHVWGGKIGSKCASFTAARRGARQNPADERIARSPVGGVWRHWCLCKIADRQMDTGKIQMKQYEGRTEDCFAGGQFR